MKDGVDKHLNRFNIQAQSTDIHARFPLHRAMADANTSISIIHDLIVKHPNAFYSVDIYGCCPFFYTLETKDSSFILCILEMTHIAKMNTSEFGENVFHTCF